MIPFLIPAVPVVGLIAAAIYALSKKVQDKSVVLVGPRRSGKTTLQDAILSSDLSAHVLGSGYTRKVSWGQRTFRSEGLRVHSADTPGGIDALAASLAAMQRVPDLAVLVVAADQLERAEYLRHCEAMATAVVNWSPRQRRALVVTHADLVLDHDRPVLSDLDDIDVGDLAKLLDVQSFLLTNLTHQRSAEFVVRRLIRELTR